jgi:hypothetical protein
MTHYCELPTPPWIMVILRLRLQLNTTENVTLYQLSSHISNKLKDIWVRNAFLEQHETYKK